MLAQHSIYRTNIKVLFRLLVAVAGIVAGGHSAKAMGPKGDVVIPLTDKPVLMPGQFEWQPELSPDGEISININLSLQMLEVFRGGTLIARSTISSGRPGYSTPTGTFPILEKDLTHYSNLYNNAPMHFMQRLTFQGVALHAGDLPGMPASHGCIRVPPTFAKQLFKVTSPGDLITVFGKASEYRPPSSKSLRARAVQANTPVPSALVSSPDAPPKVASAVVADRPSLAAVRSGDTSSQPSGEKKSMAQLESEELKIRNDAKLNSYEKMKELKRVWAEQRQLMGLP